MINISKLIKISTCSVALSAMITGLSTMATENAAGPQENSSMQVEISDVEGQLYQKALDLKKNEIYAKHFAMLVSRFNVEEEKAHRRADIYEKAIGEGHNANFSYKYAELISEGIDEHTADIESMIYDEKLEEFKSQMCAEYYAMLKTRYNIKGEKAKRIALLYEQEAKSRKDKVYASEYVLLRNIMNLDERDARLMAEEYSQKARSGKDLDYLEYYILLNKVFKIGEKEAKRRAKIYYDRLKKLNDEYFNKSTENSSQSGSSQSEYGFINGIMRTERLKEKIKIYNIFNVSNSIGGYLDRSFVKKEAQIYEQELFAGRTEEYAAMYAFLTIASKQPEKKVREAVDIYMEKRKERLEKKDALYYSYLIVERKLDKSQAKLNLEQYMSMISEGKPEGYAHEYAFAITNGLDKYEAGQKARIYMKEIEDGRGHLYASYYASLLSEHKIDDDLARKMANDYMIERKERNHGYAAKYVSLVNEDHIKKNYARIIARIYEREKDNGMSDIYSNCYAKSAAKFGEFGAKERAEIYEREFIKGKSKIFIDRYIDLIIDDRMDEKMAERYADLYCKCRDDGKGYNSADYYAYLIVKKGIDEDLVNEIIGIYLTERKLGRSDTYARKYSYLLMCKSMPSDQARAQAGTAGVKMIETDSRTCTNYYIKQLFNEKLGKALAEKKTAIYMKSLVKNSKVFSDYFASLVVIRGMSKDLAYRQSQIYEQKIREFKDCFYSDCYAILMTEGRTTEKQASKMAELYSAEMKRTSKDYGAIYYIRLMMDKGLSEESARKQTDIYLKSIEKTKDHQYSYYYAELKMNNHEMTEEEIRLRSKAYAEKMKEGRDSNCADYYSFLLVNKGLERSKAEAEVNVYEDALKRTGNKIYASYYSVLAIERNIERKDIEELMKIYIDQIENRGKSCSFADYYAMISIYGKKNIEDQRKVYEKMINDGKSCLFSYICSYIVTNFDIEPNKAVSMSREFVSIIKEKKTEFKYILTSVDDMCGYAAPPSSKRQKV